MMYLDCCYECGKKKYGTILQEGITIHMGVCIFCKKKTMIIPGADWAGQGD